jgi:hypothetical protein
MKTFNRKCVKDFKQGDFELKFNEIYLTSDILEDGRVMIFTKYWVRMPLNYFDEGDVFTSEEFNFK